MTCKLRWHPRFRKLHGGPVVTEKSVLVAGVMLRPTADTLLGHDVGVPVRPPDPANIGALARRLPARNPGVTAPTAQLAGFGFANLRRLGAASRGPEYPVTSPNRRCSSQSLRASAIS
jgi:hypothetical protein